MASIKGYELKNIKTFQGREWRGIQGSIYHNGKKVGWYSDPGDGGMADIDLYLPKEKNGNQRAEREKQLAAAVKKYYTEYPLRGEYARLAPDAELFFGALIQLSQDEKIYKKVSQNGYGHIVFYRKNKNEPNESYTAFMDKGAMEEFIERGEFGEMRRYDSAEDFVIR